MPRPKPPPSFGSDLSSLISSSDKPPLRMTSMCLSPSGYVDDQREAASLCPRGME
eukprot:CAMPEP_0185727752 /NCGR_PEP_ID=MMETSP1171-20130828/3359_1 /TAXON_ID=374046 /ORGANISM="Helicotheca tamensis, Strain CCMP826" /LENGTH=54 /DNA_ID=CAMNT_0028396379 /DNA_START=43 /DNA_END=208 /DNA_ORIENTATION=-